MLGRAYSSGCEWRCLDEHTAVAKTGYAGTNVAAVMSLNPSQAFG